MNQDAQHSFTSVISVNPYTDKYLSSMASFLSETTSPQYDKNQFAISHLNANGFMTSKISISKNIPEEDLYDAISNKVYDDLSLDQALTYQIQYIETFNNLDEKDRFFHVFVADPSTINDVYADAVEAIKYIDVIIPTPLLLKSLYAKDIIEDGGLHCFIYFQKDDTFLTVYNEKEFLFTKSLNYSFVQMHERFCELYGERIEYEEFVSFVSRENLKETSSEYKEYFIKLYKEIFANTNSILTYVKRVFDIEKIDHIYIGTQFSTVTKLDEIAEVELNVKTSNFDFDYGFDSDGTYIDQIDSLMQIYAILPNEDKYECNFTNFVRPPKFTQRESGKLIMLTAASFIIAFIYPVSYWMITYAQTFQYQSLSQEYIEVHNQKITREATIKNRETDKEKIIALLNKENKEYRDKKNTLIKIHDVKVNYPMKAKHLALLTKDLNNYNIGLESLTYSEANNSKTFQLSLLASNDRKITLLLEHLTKKHEGKFNFSLEKIFYNEESTYYSSELKVKLL